MATRNEPQATSVLASHTREAQVRIDELRAMRQRIPHFKIPAGKGSFHRLVSAASLPPEFIELTAVAVTNSRPLVREGGADPLLTRDLMKFAEAYDPLADELEALAHFVRHSTTAARNRAGRDALVTYALAKRLARLPETTGLAPYVDDMRRALGNRIRKPKAKRATSDTTEPVTVTDTPSKE